MTYSDEFVTRSGDTKTKAEEENYPTAFGITFTPQVSGVALALLGVLGAVYVLTTFVMPAYQNYQKLKADEQAKIDQVNQQKSGVIDKRFQEADSKLKQAQRLKADVLNLFSNEDTLDTLLLDINKFVTSKQARLINYKPQGGDATVINDSSLGAQVNNKLKRKTIELEMEGTFEQTQAVMRDIERLQPLLMVRNLNVETSQSPFVVFTNLSNRQTQLISLPSTVKTKFTFDAILPLTPEDVAKLAPPPEEKKDGQPQGNQQQQQK
jgi:Type II secretion system (T2SS), protein M subtype b